MSKITVNQSKRTQKRVLKFANGLSLEGIEEIINSMISNDPRFRNSEAIKVYEAYILGWRGNNVPNVSPLTPAKTGFAGRIKNAVKALKGL